MLNEKLFLRLVSFSPLIFIPLVVGILSFSSIYLYNQSFNISINQIEKDLLKIEKKAIEAKISNISDLISYQKSIIKQNLMSLVKNRVESAHAIAENIYTTYHGKKTDEEIQKIIKTALETLVWNDGRSSIRILDYDGISKLAPKHLKHVEGTSRTNYQDATGRYIIQEEINISKNKGEGFIWDILTRTNGISSKQHEQLIFVKDFGHYNWYIGSSKCLDVATKITDNELFEAIKKIDNIDNHYVFIINTSGDIFMNKSIPEFVNKNAFEIDNKFLQEIVIKILKEMKNKNSTFLTYNWNNLQTNKVEEKISYFKKIQNTDWIIGTGFYLSDIQQQASKQKNEMNNFYYLESTNIIYLVFIMMVFSLLVSYYISSKIKQNFLKYETKINRKNKELQELNENLESKVVQRTAELQKIKDDFEKLATTDFLTKIHNRYSIMSLLSSELHRARRYNTPLSLIMYDIDFFKKVNDTFGHIVGDNILVELSALVQANLRDIDILGRYGGEEFLIVLPSTTFEDAKVFAERLRRSVEEHTFDIVKNLTISIGVVEFKTDDNIDSIFKQVDDLLYKSKNNGRNRVSF